MRWIGEFIGFPVASGAFTSGGTISNLTALAAARERAVPGARRRPGGANAIVYCSQEVHYSVTRAVELLGIGSDRLRDPLDHVADGSGRTCLQRRSRRTVRRATARGGGGIRRHHAHRRGGRPRRRRRRLRRAGVWLHVDGAYGLPAAAVRARSCSRASLAPTRARWTPTNGSTCRRHVASSWSRHEDALGRSRTSRAISPTSSTSCTPLTSHWSTRGRSAR